MLNGKRDATEEVESIPDTRLRDCYGRSRLHSSRKLLTTFSARPASVSRELRYRYRLSPMPDLGPSNLVPIENTTVTTDGNS